MTVPFRDTEAFERLSEAILHRVSRGFSSCSAVILVLNPSALQSYREHSGARRSSHGFEDYDYAHWNNLTPEEKTSIRLTRLKAWMNEFDPPPLQREWTESQFAMKHWS